ncbi:MAG: hypothetical protein ACNFW9_01390 [Candidatus Kerfeldbacteria bacterium]
MSKHIKLVLVIGVLLFPIIALAFGADECENGYVWEPKSGVGCVQEDCNIIPNAHYSYVQDCVCGSSGSMYEDPLDSNTECYYPFDYESCPSCVYACVGADEECPALERDNYVEELPPVVNTNTNLNTNQSTNTNFIQNVNVSLSTTGVATTSWSCQDHCKTFLRGHKNAELVSFEGDYPDCKCQIDVKDSLNQLTNTISVDGDEQTTYTYGKDGSLIKKVKINRKDEVEKVRIRIGFKYTQEEIDKILDPAKIDVWFQDKIKDIKTETNEWNAQFWWQHMVAIWDHGRNGNSATFVDTYQFGRCGDSMLWLERDLLNKLEIGKDPDNPGHKYEGILSITGEKYGNMLNHTSLMIRPQGISNIEWESLVKELKKLSGGEESNPGIKGGDLKNVDPRLLDAKVLDPYKKEVTTVREFIKGWSYIRIG